MTAPALVQKLWSYCNIPRDDCLSYGNYVDQLALSEQTRIVAEAERRLSVVDELESVVKANLQRATRLHQSILQNAFKSQLQTGEE